MWHIVASRFKSGKEGIYIMCTIETDIFIEGMEGNDLQSKITFLYGNNRKRFICKPINARCLFLFIN